MVFFLLLFYAIPEFSLSHRTTQTEKQNMNTHSMLELRDCKTDEVLYVYSDVTKSANDIILA